MEMTEMDAENELENELREYPLTVRIFATGAFLKPARLEDGKWGWVVCKFEDDSFYYGKKVHPCEITCIESSGLAKQKQTAEKHGTSIRQVGNHKDGL